MNVTTQQPANPIGPRPSAADNIEPDAGEEEVIAARRLLNIINGSWMTQATHVAARLGLIDLLADGPRTAAQLAQSTGCNVGALYRLMKALCSLGICLQRPDDSFEATALGAPLGSQAPCSVRSWALQWGGPSWQVWENLLHSVRTGESARTLITGTEGFAHLEQDPQAALLFNQAMAELTRLVALEVAQNYDFDGKSVVDVGGGYGELLAAVLERHPNAAGILFDMPHAIPAAADLFMARGLKARCRFIAGDFFTAVPAGADIYMLKSVIHDWDDDHSRAILETCRRAMSPQARLLLIDRTMPDRLQTTAEHQALAQSDLNMLVALAAQERSEAEFDALLRSAGFMRTGSKRVGAFCLIEARICDLAD